MSTPLTSLDLLALLAEGAWGPLRVGMTRDAVRSAVGPPDGPTAAGEDRFATAVWRYGPVRVLFDGNRLVRVQAAATDAVELAPPLGLGPGEVRDLRALELRTCEQLIDLAAISYEVVVDPDDGAVLVRTEAGGGVLFPSSDAAATAVAASVEHR